MKGVCSQAPAHLTHLKSQLSTVERQPIMFSTDKLTTVLVRNYLVRLIITESTTHLSVQLFKMSTIPKFIGAFVYINIIILFLLPGHTSPDLKAPLCVPV